MDLRYEISQLFDLAFGIKSPIFIPYGVKAKQETISVTLPGTKANEASATYIVDGISTENTGTVKSWTGNEVLYPITFEAGIYKKYDHNGKLLDVRLADFILPFATLAEFTRSKNIIQTEITGNTGTVKELISFSDWNIRIRGICLTDNARNAFKSFQEQKEQLIKWEEIASEIKVNGDQFRELGINYLVIESISFPAMEGRPNAVAFELVCKSDEPLELTIKV